MTCNISTIMVCIVVLSVIQMLPIVALSILHSVGRRQQPQPLINQPRVIDLRSDTVTKPSSLMRKAMFEAEVGDDVFEEDPTVNKLEHRVATMFGKESSLFFPSGTMSNLAATMSWCGSRGSEAIVGSSSHMYLYEQANIAQIAGVSPHVLPNQPDGTIDLNLIERGIRPSNIHYPITELISIENTHNYCGGRIVPLTYMESVYKLAQSRNIPVHIDGARIWNAASASGTTLSKLAEHADSITACLSKGLGAPAGSMLIGTKSLIAKARRIRKALGGGMRQSGILAAAGLQALDDFESGLLEDDHWKATLLAEQIADLPGLLVDIRSVNTNIVLVHLEYPSSDPATFAAKLKTLGVLVLPFGPRSVRIVAHRDISPEDLPAVVAAFREASAHEWLAFTRGNLEPSELLDHGDPGEASRDPPIIQSINGDDNYDGPQSPRIYHDDLISNEYDDDHQQNESETNQQADIIIDRSGSVGAAVVAPQIIVSDDILHKADDDSMSIVLPTIHKPLDSVIINPPLSTSTSSTTNGTPSSKAVDNTNNIIIDINKPNFEEVRIFGMTVSPEGFCVLLQGLVCDRVLKVLVTPQDPMSDGLDRDEVETSEAVTLLQLLQGIDVETYLAKDALSSHFGGDNKHKYSLRQVTINEVDPRKKFSGSLLGKQKRLSDASDDMMAITTTSATNIITPAAVSPSIPSSTSSLSTPSISISRSNAVLIHANNSLDEVIVSEPLPSSSSTTESTKDTVDSSIITQQQQLPHPSSVTSIGATSTSPSISSGTSQPLTEVKVDSAYFAIALALRHHSAIVVRSDLLNDDELSYTTDELRSYYPKMVETTSFIPKIDNRGHAYVTDRMIKRYHEAIRQRNDEKIKQLEPHVYGVVGGSSSSSSSGGGNTGGSSSSSSSGGTSHDSNATIASI